MRWGTETETRMAAAARQHAAAGPAREDDALDRTVGSDRHGVAGLRSARRAQV